LHRRGSTSRVGPKTFALQSDTSLKYVSQIELCKPRDEPLGLFFVGAFIALSPDLSSCRVILLGCTVTVLGHWPLLMSQNAASAFSAFFLTALAAVGADRSLGGSIAALSRSVFVGALAGSNAARAGFAAHPFSTSIFARSGRAPRRRPRHRSTDFYVQAAEASRARAGCF
jgi:hypothetical protein